MPDAVDRTRRLLLGAALSGAAGRAFAQADAPARSLRRMEPLKRADAGVLEVAYHEVGHPDGPVAILLHGFPYDIHTYVDVAPQLAAQGCRVIVPYLRGFGATRFRDPATPRSGEQAAIGADVIALMDALGIRRAVLAGHNWGGRAACVAAALWPERCAGVATVNSYLIQDLSRAMVPAVPDMNWRSGTNIIFSSSADTPGWPPIGARSPGYCGSSGRPIGNSTTPLSSAPRRRTTIPTMSTW